MSKHQAHQLLQSNLFSTGQTTFKINYSPSEYYKFSGRSTAVISGGVVINKPKHMLTVTTNSSLATNSSDGKRRVDVDKIRLLSV